MSGFLSSLLSPFAGGGSSAPSVDVAELKQALADGAVPVLIDVRSAAEFAGGHVPDAINIPLERVGSAPELEAYRGKDVYLICQSGARSGRAQAQLLGTHQVINVRGGTGGWRAAGYPVV